MIAMNYNARYNYNLKYDREKFTIARYTSILAKWLALLMASPFAYNFYPTLAQALCFC